MEISSFGSVGAGVRVEFGVLIGAVVGFEPPAVGDCPFLLPPAAGLDVGVVFIDGIFVGGIVVCVFVGAGSGVDIGFAEGRAVGWALPMGEGVCGTLCLGFGAGVGATGEGVGSSGGGVGSFVGWAVGEAVRTSKWAGATTGGLEGAGTSTGAVEGVLVTETSGAASLKFAATI